MDETPSLHDLQSRLFGGFYRGRRVLVTGHSGFKGSWLTVWLRLLGAEVTGYGKTDAVGGAEYTCSPDDEIQMIEGDVTDFGSLLQVIEAVRPSVVIHLAGQSIVQRAFDDPISAYAVNTLGTVHLLEAARRVGHVDAMVLVTSDKSYKNTGRSRPYKESDALGGSEPYGASKAAAELAVRPYLIDSFRQTASPPVTYELATARAGNVVGGGDWSLGRLVPDTVRAVLRGDQLVIRQRNAIRPWQFVLEPLSGYLLLGSRLASVDGWRWRQAWNFGPAAKDQVTVQTLVSILAERLGRTAEVEQRPPSICEDEILRLDASGARRGLGWECLLSIDEAIALTADWYRQWDVRGDVRSVMEHQVRHYATLGRERGAVWAT